MALSRALRGWCCNTIREQTYSGSERFHPLDLWIVCAANRPSDCHEKWLIVNCTRKRPGFALGLWSGFGEGAKGAVARANTFYFGR